MSHPVLMPERAFQQVIPQIEEFLKGVQLISPPRTELRYRKHQNTYILKIWDSHWLTETRLAQWELAPMPGCCGVVVSTGAVVEPMFRRKGLGRVLNQVRLAQAQLMGYGEIICTVTDDNKEQIRILKKNHWKAANSFVNPKTTNRVHVYFKKL